MAAATRAAILTGPSCPEAACGWLPVTFPTSACACPEPRACRGLCRCRHFSSNAAEPLGQEPFSSPQGASFNWAGVGSRPVCVTPTGCSGSSLPCLSPGLLLGSAECMLPFLSGPERSPSHSPWCPQSPRLSEEVGPGPTEQVCGTVRPQGLMGSDQEASEAGCRLLSSQQAWRLPAYLHWVLVDI